MPNRNSLQLVLTSDTHGLHRELEVPGGDILIHAGDFTMFGRSPAEVRDFDLWLRSLPHQHKVVVPGNHEFMLETDIANRSLLGTAHLLIGQAVTLNGLTIWGSPVTSQSGGAFAIPQAEQRQRYWDQIPPTDVLVTHGPPLGILDGASDSPGAGDPELLQAVRRVSPLLHVFGHVHAATGSCRDGNTLFINCAALDQDGAPTNRPTVVSMPRLKGESRRNV